MLTYGNANRTLLPYLKQETFLDTLLNELYSYPYPDNNGQEAIDEINQLIHLTNSISDKPDQINRYKIYDENFVGYLIKVLVNNGANEEELNNTLDSLHNDINPIIVKLKYYYQRIRPTQLANMLQMSMYPYDSISSNTPSYPSGHTITSKVYCTVLGNFYPKFYKQLMELSQDVSNSRLYMGLHYSSDANFGIFVSDCILNHPDFKKKYKL
jgi:hypothetical protein